MTLHIERPAPPRPPAPDAPSGNAFRERRGIPAAAPIRLAHIVSVSGSHAVAMLERQDAIANADSRVQIGALVKIVTPVSAVMGIVYITTPKYISLLFTEKAGNLMLAACVIWMSVGIMVMRKMINFKH